MTPPPLPDAAARTRAVREIDRSMMVEAGAGTGKTTLIADRAVELLAQGRAAAHELAVITFTEAAAIQLESRIRERLGARLASERNTEAAGGSAERAARLERAVSDLDRASIQTIHSFAAAIVRRRPVEARVDPRFTIGDGETQRSFRETAWSDYLAAEASPGSPALREILEAGVGLDSLRAAAMRWTDHRDLPPGAGARGAAALPSRPGGLARARALAERARVWADGAAAGCRDPSDLLRAGLERAAREAGTIAGLDEAAAAAALSAGRPETTIHRKAGRQKAWRSQHALDAARACAASWPEEFSAYRRELEVRVTATASVWVRGYMEAYEALKRKAGHLDFQDLLLAARDVLRSPAAARDLARRFRAVLVDEFQDTDPLQVEIVRLLTGAGSGEPIPGPRPGAIFIVGDPKQSIYRFRRADSEVYRKARDWIESGPGAAQRAMITANFRCRPGVVAWVNAVFARLLDEYAPIAPSREAAPGEAVSYVLCGTDAAAGRQTAVGGGSAEETRVAEARSLARVLAREIESGTWLVEGAGGATRRANPGDAVVLFRAFGDVALYEDALREAGVRCRTHAGRRYFARPEVAWFASLVRAVDQPHDEVAVVAALRSPWLGASDAEILTARLGRGRLDPLRVEPPRAMPPPVPSEPAPGTSVEEVDDVVVSGLRFLADAHRRRNEAPVGSVVERLLAGTGGVALGLARAHRAGGGAAGAEGGSDLQGALNLEKITALARRHEAEGGTFRSFVRWLGRAVEEEVEEPEAPVLASEDDSVRLMTIHAAKGLEFPIVVLADLGRKAPGGEGFVVDRERGQVEIRLSGTGGSFRSAGFEAALDKEKDELVRERQRLFYVAATRARDHLVLVLPPPRSAGRSSGSFLEDLMRAGALPEEDGEPPEALKPFVRTIRADEAPAAVASSLLPAAGPTPAGRIAPGAAEDVTAMLFLPADASAAPRGNAPSDANRDVPWSSAAWRARRGALIASASKGWRFLAASRADPGGAQDVPDVAPGDPGAGGAAAGRPVDPGIPPSATSSPWALAAAARARAFGLAVHAVLESVDLNEPGDVRARARAAALSSGVGDRSGDVETTVRRALDLPTIARARARRTWREAPVAVAERGVMLEGQIDLAYEEDDGSLVVADFKTDAVAGEAEARERAGVYRAQLALYALALERGTGRRVGALVLLFVSAGVEVRLPFDEVLRELAESALRAAAES